MEIRIATIKDIDQIALLFIEQFDIQAEFDPYLIQSGSHDKQLIENTITGANSQIFVADEDEKIVGFVSVYEKKSLDFNFMVPHKYAYIMELITTRDYQGKGIATKLMNEVKRWALDRELDHIELTVASNNSAVDFYIKTGYEEVLKTMRCRL